MPETNERFTFPMDGRTLSALWTAADQARAVALVAHGAGTNVEHPFYDGVAEGFAAGGITTMRFNFPYTEEGRKSPDRPPVLLEAWRAALEVARGRSAPLPLVATGKSMGGRMASMLAAEMGGTFPAVALVFFGYPLHAPGRPDTLRDEHLPSIRCPMLFIQGTSDSLARFDLIEALIERLGPTAKLHAVDDGDHSFRIRGKRRPDVEIGRELGRVAADFIHTVVS